MTACLLFPDSPFVNLVIMRLEAMPFNQQDPTYVYTRPNGEELKLTMIADG